FIFISFLINDSSISFFSTPSLHDALPIFFISFGNGRQTLFLSFDNDVQWNSIITAFPFFVCINSEKQISSFCRFHIFIFFIACLDRKSTRLNSSHVKISYAVFCLKKKTLI